MPHKPNSNLKPSGAEAALLRKICEDVLSKTRAKVEQILRDNDFQLDPARSYLDSSVLVAEPLAASARSTKLGEQLKRSKSTEEFDRIRAELDDEAFKGDASSILRQALSEGNEPFKQTALPMYGMREMSAEGIDLLYRLKDLNLLKSWLSCLFTPGNQIRNNYVSAACQPWGPVLIWVQEGKTWKTQETKESAATSWIIFVYSPKGTQVHTLRYDREKSRLITTFQSEEDTGKVPPSKGLRPRMLYSPTESLEFFSHSGLPLHPFCFERGPAQTDPFSWANLAFTDTNFWDFLRFGIAPRMSTFLPVLKETAQDADDRDMLATFEIYEKLLENPEFFLELVLNLGTLSKSEGLEYMDGLGRLVDNLLFSLAQFPLHRM